MQWGEWNKPIGTGQHTQNRDCRPYRPNILFFNSILFDKAQKQCQVEVKKNMIFKLDETLPLQFSNTAQEFAVVTALLSFGGKYKHQNHSTHNSRKADI